MKLSEIRTGLARRADDQDIDTDAANEWINESQRDIQRTNKGKHFWLEADAVFSTIAGVEKYLISDIAADFNADIDLRMQGKTLDKVSDALTYIDDPDYPDITKENKPTKFFIYEGYIYLKEVPDDVYTMRLRYYKAIPDLVEDDDTPIMPEEYQEVLILGALLRYISNQDYSDVQSTNLVMNEYNDILSDIVGDSRPNRPLNILGRK